jgi:outer membrane protein assembly factor BamB
MVEVATPAVGDGLVYYPTYAGHVYAINIRTGKEKWQFHDNHPQMASPAVVAGLVYVNSGSGHTRALDAQTGAERWDFVSQPPLETSPIPGDGVLYVAARTELWQLVDEAVLTTGAVAAPPATRAAVDNIKSGEKPGADVDKLLPTEK